MGFRRTAGVFPVVQRQKEMRRRTQRKPLQLAETHRRVLCAGNLLFSSFLSAFWLFASAFYGRFMLSFR